VEAGQTQVVTVRYQPQSPGEHATELEIGHDDADLGGDGVYRVVLWGSATDGASKRYYYLKDHLGSVRATVNESGVTVGWDDYYPFGQVMPGRSMVGGNATKDGYTGHDLDDETGLNYAGARYLDPVLGRWLAMDPLADDYGSIVHDSSVNWVAMPL